MKKKLSLVVVLSLTFLTFTTFTTVHATSIQEVEEKAEELDEEKEKIEVNKAQLSENAEKLSREMLEIQDEINLVYEKIQEAEVELTVALTVKENQYDDMKTRIRYMYENSSSNSLMEMMFDVRDINDFLNRIEYAEQVTAYDRRKLEEFQSAVTDIEDKQKALELENDKLDVLQKDIAVKKAEVELMLAQAEISLEELNDEIGNNAKILEALIKAAEEEARKLEEANQAAAGTAGGNVVSGSGIFAHPIPGFNYMSSPFGYRIHPITGEYKLHNGTDFAATSGTPVYAAMDGTVTIAQYSSSAGNYISINHGNGLVTIYMHNTSLYVSPGDKVTKGQNIAASGNTGNSTGPHLHFQVMLNGTAVNAMNYL